MRNLRYDVEVEITQPETKKGFYILGSFILAGVLSAGVFVYKFSPKTAVEGLILEVPEYSLPLAEDRRAPRPVLKQEPVSPLNLSARSALVRDRASGMVLYEKHPEISIAPASLTKLMTAIVAVNNVDLEEIVQIVPEDLEVSEYRTGFSAGEKITIHDLLKAMLIASANDAAKAVARTVGGTEENFVGYMNRKAKILGMRETAFRNPVGFDEPGHFSTASNLARLVEEFLNYPELLEIVKTKETDIFSFDRKARHRLITTNKLMKIYSEVLGLKTGYTSEAKGNLIILTDTYYSIALGSSAREQETEKIMQWLKDNWIWVKNSQP